MWSKTPPTCEGYYWWRAGDWPCGREIVFVSQSNHKPPWWQWWGMCEGGCGEDPNCGGLNINRDGTGPVEDGYTCDNWLGGEWGDRIPDAD